jgi:hypothetical protein
MKFPKLLMVGLLSLGTIAASALPGMARAGFIDVEAKVRSGPSMYADQIDGLPEGTPLEDRDWEVFIKVISGTRTVYQLSNNLISEIISRNYSPTLSMNSSQ